MRLQLLTASATLVAGFVLLQVQPATAQGTQNAAEFTKATQCAGLFEFVGQQLPAGNPARADVEKRETAWMDYAKSTAGGDRRKAISGRIRETKALTDKFRELGGDMGKMTAELASLNAQCEAPPPSYGKTANRTAAAKPAAKPKAARAISDKDRRNGDLAIRCAGMARVYKDDPLAVSLYGTEAIYREIIVYYRPDLGGADLENRIKAKSQEHARLYIADFEKRKADHMAGRTVPEDSYESSRRAGECAKAVNLLRAVKVIK